MSKFDALTESELFELFHGGSMSSKHMLLLYSLIVGLSAQVIVDLGLGNSTRVARAASRVTGGTVYSCDADEVRYRHYEKESEPNWKFFCLPSSSFIELLPEPIDFVFHDASHERQTVTNDLRSLFPKMKRYGMICVHDTQQPRYQLLEAVHDAIEAVKMSQVISAVTLPYGCGLTLLRVETASHAEITPAGRLRGDRVVTKPRMLA